MLEAAGIAFTSPDGKVLLCHRTDGLGWAFPGGGKKDEETIGACAVREVWEETGYRAGHSGKFLCRRVKDDCDFTTFHYEVDDEFIPKLNHEHDSYVWAAPDAAMQMQLHPGVPIALRLIKGPMTEVELSKAIRDCELVSPQFIENVCLIDMRISGTGFSYRPALKEWVYRREGLYLTSDFLERCNGIPIIYDHPASKILDSNEFSKRVVGTMQLPYIKGTEVWGIARLYDAQAIKDVIQNTMSTSPSVVFRDPKVNYTIELTDKETLLIEGNPSFLDHLAICEKGVWDKGEDPTGIRVDSESSGDPQEQVVTAKLDDTIGEVPVASLPPTGGGDFPAPPMQSIPPAISDLVTGISAFAERLDKFMARRDLMVR